MGISLIGGDYFYDVNAFRLVLDVDLYFFLVFEIGFEDGGSEYVSYYDISFGTIGQ